MAEKSNNCGIRSWTCQRHVSVVEASIDFQVETWRLDSLRRAGGFLRCREDLDPISREIQGRLWAGISGVGTWREKQVREIMMRNNDNGAFWLILTSGLAWTDTDVIARYFSQLG